MVRLLTLLGSEPVTYRAELAEVLDASLPTIDRYIRELRETGWQIDTDPDAGGYVLAPGQYLPPLDVTVEEALALVVSAALIGQMPGPLAPPLAQIVEKVRSAVPEALREGLADVLPQVHIQTAAHEGDAANDVWHRVVRAIDQRRALRAQYEAANGDAEGAGAAFRFDPYCLFFSRRAWYVVGRHHGRLDSDRGPLRTLKLQRFTALKQIDQPFAIPDHFSMDAYLGDRWGMVREADDRFYEVVLLFKKPYANSVAETVWHKSQADQWIGDELKMRFRVQGLSEIAHWILSYGPGVFVAEPPELARKVRDLHEKALEQYEEDSAFNPEGA